MTTQNVARTIRKEHEKVEELVDSLRAETAVVPRVNLDPWIARMRERFEHFRAHLYKHMALEEQGGYLSPVVERFPALSGDIDRLGHEHVEMRQLLDDVYASLKKLRAEDRLMVRDTCARINALLGYVDHHEGEENQLLSFAFSHEDGTKD